MRSGFAASPSSAEYAKSPTPAGSESKSKGSCPARTESTSPQSSAVRAIGPSLSIVHAIAIAPCRLTRPKLGRIPEIPHHDIGQIIEPRVSEPIAQGASAADTIAPEPLDDPHVQYFIFQGFLHGPVNDAFPAEYPNPPANSIIAAFPISTAPARFSRSITVAL